MTPEQVLEVSLRTFDEEEARATETISRMAEARDRAIKFFWPAGTRVRWKQTTTREVFEAEGVVTDAPATVSTRTANWISVSRGFVNAHCTVAELPLPPDALELPPGRYPTVMVQWTKHPSLAFQSSLCVPVLVAELEKLP